MTEFEKLLEKINGKIEQPLVDARFGDQWREHQKRMLEEGQINTDMLFDIAWKQGRRAILLERVLKRLIPSDEEIQKESEEIYGNATFKNLGQKVTFCEHFVHFKSRGLELGVMQGGATSANTVGVASGGMTTVTYAKPPSTPTEQ